MADVQVLCLVCNKAFMRVTGSHLKRHNLTCDLYKQRFGKDAILEHPSVVEARNRRISMTKTGVVSPFKGKKRSDAFREKIKASHWANKPIEETIAIRKILSENGKKVFDKLNKDGRAWRMPKGYHSEEHKQRMRDLMTGRACTWSDAIKKTHWVNKPAEDVASIIEKIQATDSQTKKTKRGFFESKKMNQSFHYASSFELRRMMFFDKHDDIVSFTKRHGIKLAYTIDEKRHFYIPDFLVKLRNGRVILEEIKGWVRDKRIFEAKCLVARSFCELNGFEFRVLFERDLENI